MIYFENRNSRVRLCRAYIGDCGGVSWRGEVFGTEINPKIKTSLAENRAHFFEPGLDDLIAKHNRKNFHCMDKFNTPPRTI